MNNLVKCKEEEIGVKVSLTRFLTFSMINCVLLEDRPVYGSNTVSQALAKGASLEM